jgi:uncharacterized protein
MRRINSIDWLFLILLIIGGLNWGLVALFNFNLVSALFGADTVLTNIIYILVGASALYVLASFATKSSDQPRV